MSTKTQAADPGQAVLELRGVEAAYGRSTVLRNVNLAVEPGTVVALLGPNGAGKTTLLRIAAGLLPPAKGSVLIAGVDQGKARPDARARAGLCLVPEGRGIFPGLSVRENLRLQVPPWAKDDRVDRALDAFPILRDRLRQTAGSMSGGEQQMLACARCYLAEPAIVLVDEVSMGLAPRIIDEIFASLLRLAEDGTALLLVEQYVNRALAVANRVHLLQRGEITFSGEPSELDEEQLLKSYLGVEAPDEASIYSGENKGEPDGPSAGRTNTRRGK